MSYQEKKTIASIVSGILLLIAYCIYAYSKLKVGIAGEGEVTFWAKTMLLFIVIGVVFSIVIQVLFHILLSMSEEAQRTLAIDMVEDEMSKLIELKAMKAGYITVGVGFVMALVTYLFNSSVVALLQILFFAFALGSILEGVLQIYYYRKGV